MKKKLYLHTFSWDREFIGAFFDAPMDNDPDYIQMGCIDVDIPDSMILTDEQFDHATYLAKIECAQKKVKECRESLTNAEDDLKNCLALTVIADVVDDLPY